MSITRSLLVDYSLSLDLVGICANWKNCFLSHPESTILDVCHSVNCLKINTAKVFSFVQIAQTTSRNRRKEKSNCILCSILCALWMRLKQIDYRFVCKWRLYCCDFSWAALKSISSKWLMKTVWRIRTTTTRCLNKVEI